MKKIPSLVVIFFAFSAVAFAQDRLLTLDDIFSPDANKRVKFNGNPMTVQWTKDGKAFRQVINGRLMRVDAMTGQATPYLDTGKLVAALSRAGYKADDLNVVANSPVLQFNPDESGILFNNSGDLSYYDVSSGNIRRLTNYRDVEKEADFSPDVRWVSLVRANILYFVDVETDSEKHLTGMGNRAKEPDDNGYTDRVDERGPHRRRRPAEAGQRLVRTRSAHPRDSRRLCALL